MEQEILVKMKKDIHLENDRLLVFKDMTHVYLFVRRSYTESRETITNDESTVVSWVRERLNNEGVQGWRHISAEGNRVQQNLNYYDALLAYDVERFQRRNNLVPDRILGQQTLLMLWLKGAQ